MDWTENQQCVLCDKSGNLLICNNDGCPISVHKNCMGCDAHFDEVGNFQCPYCVYKHYTLEASRLRSNVLLTKKALSTFLERETRDENHQDPPIVKKDNKEEDESLSKDKSVDENVSVGLETCNESNNILVHETTSDIINKNGGVDGGSDVNKCRMMVVYKPKSDHADVCNQLQSDVSKRMKVDQCKYKVVDQENETKNADVWLTLDDQITCKKRNKSVRFNMNGRKEEHAMDHGAKKEFDQLSMSNRNKRCRVRWSEQEEEMLKEGVQKYSVLTNKNLPWKKILEFGRHVFNSSRTPAELKDKWRKITKFSMKMIS